MDSQLAKAQRDLNHTCCCIWPACAPVSRSCEMWACATCAPWWQGKPPRPRWAPDLPLHSLRPPGPGVPAWGRAGAVAGCRAYLSSQEFILTVSQWDSLGFFVFVFSDRSEAYRQPAGRSLCCSRRPRWCQCRWCFLYLPGPPRRWSECSGCPADFLPGRQPSLPLLPSEEQVDESGLIINNINHEDLPRRFTRTDLVVYFQVTL